ncbi:polysaccharide biosynthesis C-terminal domain-containing protein, partial [Eubacteriales bacterium OttesenSCG-928-A19]|nr:polysaccharide biosynthesis C-terminal domain-containing protein [Eubacteriales bacterium OttesenSCG-928-A19]
MMNSRRITREDRRQMSRLAWPALLENLLSTLVQFVDTAMVGALGAAATAAVAVNTTPTWLVNGLVSAFGVGGTALVARMIGAKDQEGAEEAARQVFLGVLVLATAIFVVMFSLADRIPVWMQADASLHADATRYMRIIALAFIPHFTGMALGAVLRGAGDTRTPMVIAACANLLNVIGNYFLIFPPHTASFLSLPVWGAGLGVAGAAISTAVSTGLAGL